MTLWTGRGPCIYWTGEIASLSLSALSGSYRVLVSVREGGEVVSEGGVFWWRKENEDLLNAAWQDLVLLLHTMEEKQVGGAGAWLHVQWVWFSFQIHIVKPVKSRLNSIARASSTFIDGIYDVIMMSWL